MDNVNKNLENANESSGMLKPILMTSIVALLLLAAMWVWKANQISQIRSDAEENRTLLEEKAEKQINKMQEMHLKVLAKPFVWALRKELMQGNISQVHLYLNDIVKERNVQNITITNKEGIIVSSTNKKYEGKPFSSIVQDESLTSDSTVVRHVNDSSWIMTSPIMGFNNRLGFLYLEYQCAPATFDK